MQRELRRQRQPCGQSGVLFGCPPGCPDLVCKRLECRIEIFALSSESFGSHRTQGISSDRRDMKAAGAQCSLDGVGVQLPLLCMRPRVRARRPRRMGTTGNDNGRHGWFDTVTSHLTHEPAKGSARYLSGRRAATAPSVCACGAPVPELLVIRVHRLSHPRVGQVDLVTQHDLRCPERPRENDHDRPPRMHLQPETGRTS